ncbi:MAG: FAD-dependent oxidoreductase [Rubrobacteraceae bacterium]|nr:FAD-dependent oxidoreductase [Rubrobacteraceae bacterium]
MRSRAEVVIVGAGIVGCGIAESLTRLGWRDVVVLDQGPLPRAGGSTSHAPGLMFQTNPSKTMTEFAKRSVARYRALELDGEPCCLQVGGMEVAATPERWEDLKRKHGLATSWGVESYLLSPSECVEKVPLLDGSRIHGGFYVPTDGLAKAVRACAALRRLAEGRGAEFCGETEVTGIEVRGGRVAAVETDRGRIETPLVVSCAGMWGPRLGRMVGVTVPLVPMQHQLVWTTPVEELTGESEEARHPILRHQDFSMYFRQRHERYGIGTYRHRPMPVSPDEIPRSRPSGGMPSVMPFTPEDFEPSWREARRMLPALEGARIEERINGLFSFTPDGMPLLGEAQEVRGFWVAEAIWITHALGIAEVMAAWITGSDPEMDVSGCELYRFEAHELSPSYVLARSCQSFREVYDIIHPLQPMEEPRPLRTSPFYPRQKELGAYFLEAHGWERPQWFESNRELLKGREIPERDPWSARYWSPVVGAEHQVTRERVALYDMSPLQRVEVTGTGALEFLQRLTTNDLDKPPGRITYTLMLDHRGGIRSDITVARLGEERFQLGLNGPRDVEWMGRHLPKAGSVSVRDITGGTCCVGVWGPRAREVVQSLSEDDLSDKAFPFYHARRTYLREVPVLALRLSYVGELGYELYTTSDMGLRLWDLLWEAGKPYGIIAAGRGAFESLRLEKGYRMWGRDMTCEHDPYEAGLSFAVRPGKGDFIGREALLRRREEGPRRRLSCLVLDDPQRVVMGAEPVYHEGSAVGYVTSAAYGYSIGRGIAYAWLPPELARPATRVQIEYFGERLGAEVAEEPLFDPAMKRIRS